MFTLTEADEHSQDLFLGVLSTEPPKDVWNVGLFVKDHKTMSFKINTGAQSKVMSIKRYNTLRAKPLLSSSIQVTYSGEKLQVCGECNLDCEYWDKKALLEFYVVEFDTKAIDKGL